MARSVTELRVGIHMNKTDRRARSVVRRHLKSPGRRARKMSLGLPYPIREALETKNACAERA
jgi:hypothetical protein